MKEPMNNYRRKNPTAARRGRAGFWLILALAAAGCARSDEPAAGPETAGPVTTLSVTLQGVTTRVGEPSADGGAAEISTLRVIGFDAGGGRCCNKLYNETELGQMEREGGKLLIEDIPLTSAPSAFSGGVCRFFFVANENGYVSPSSEAGAEGSPLKDVLNAVATPAEVAGCPVAMPADIAVPADTLMTASVDALVRAGQANPLAGTVRLVRCFAKLSWTVQVTVENNADVTVTLSDSLSALRPEAVPLLEGGTVSSSLGKWSLPWSEKSHSFDANVQTHSFPERSILFPECPASAEPPPVLTLKAKFKPGGNSTVKPVERTFTVNLMDEIRKEDPSDGICRNSHYHFDIKLDYGNRDVNFFVIAWAGCEMNVPPFL